MVSRLPIKFVDIVFFVGLLISPVYAFDSGLPQPGDYVLLLFSLIVIISASISGKRIISGAFCTAFLSISFWVTLISLAWVTVGQAVSFLKYPLFFIYNMGICFAMLQYFRGSPRRLVWAVHGVSCALILSGVYVLLGFGSLMRGVGLFNNPNQLAFFSLASMAFILIVHRFRIPMRPLPLFALGSGVLGILAGASLAAMAGLACITLAWAYINLTSIRNLGRFVLLLFALIATLSVSEAVSDGALSANLATRFGRADSKVANVYDDRQINRIFDYYEYDFLGAGEGGFERFVPVTSREIHSSFGTMLFSYGLPGLALFLALIWVAVRRAPPSVWLAVGGLLLYSATHNGLRTSMFWMTLSVTFYIYEKARTKPGGAAPETSGPPTPKLTKAFGDRIS